MRIISTIWNNSAILTATALIENNKQYAINDIANNLINMIKYGEYTAYFSHVIRKYRQISNFEIKCMLNKFAPDDSTTSV